MEGSDRLDELLRKLTGKLNSNEAFHPEDGFQLDITLLHRIPAIDSTTPAPTTIDLADPVFPATDATSRRPLENREKRTQERVGRRSQRRHGKCPNCKEEDGQSNQDQSRALSREEKPLTMTCQTPKPISLLLASPRVMQDLNVTVTSTVCRSKTDDEPERTQLLQRVHSSVEQVGLGPRWQEKEERAPRHSLIS